MTYKEALDFLKNEIAIDLRLASDETFVKTKGSLKLAILALEKQIQKKPKKICEDYINGRLSAEYECSVCGNPYAEDSYCSCCGQALDWSDTE